MNLSDDQAAWILTGVENGWCSEPYCQTHEPAPLDKDEEALMDEGYDLCVVNIRLLEQQWKTSQKLKSILNRTSGYPASPSPG